jgi:hypothetical protein
MVFFETVWEHISTLTTAKHVVILPNNIHWIVTAESEIRSDIVKIPTFSILLFLGLNCQINLSGNFFEVLKVTGDYFTLNRAKEAHKISGIKILFNPNFSILTARLRIDLKLPAFKARKMVRNAC